MASPKALIFQLHKHWEIIEAITRLSKEQPAFDESQVITIIAHNNPQTTIDEQAAILRTLCNAALLQWLSRSSSLQVNPLILDFVRGLTHEHELGLSAVLKARVEAVRDATSQLNEGLKSNESDLMRRGAARLSDLFRQISQQLDQDHHAIIEIAENAKSNDVNQPLAKRYQAVLDAYQNYIEPMNEMMDSGLSGFFYPYLEAAEQSLDSASEKLSIQGALYTHRLQLRQVAYQAKELRRIGRHIAQQCADTLLPLREEARQHNSLSSAVSLLLGQVRKKGLSSTFKKNSVSQLPGWQRKRRNRISLGGEVAFMMSEAINYEPDITIFPESEHSESVDLSSWVNEKALRKALTKSLPISNLMLWLKQYESSLPDEVLLRLYHELIQETQWQADIRCDEVQTDLQMVRVHYHPHQLSNIAIKESV